MNDGSKTMTINQMVDRFYTSRFNRDPYREPLEGEDIDNSVKYRVYNKSDVKDLMSLFFEFFCWALTEENISRVHFSNDLKIYRESEYPKLRKANHTDEVFLKGAVKSGEWYITNGRYTWNVWMQGELFQKMKELWKNDPKRAEIVKELEKERDEKNGNEPKH